jgi:hypothetical protein
MTQPFFGFKNWKQACESSKISLMKPSCSRAFMPILPGRTDRTQVDGSCCVGSFLSNKTKKNAKKMKLFSAKTSKKKRKETKTFPNRTKETPSAY